MQRYSHDKPLSGADVIHLANQKIEGPALRLLLDTDNEATLAILCNKLKENETLTELTLAGTKPFPIEPFVDLLKENPRIKELCAWEYDGRNFVELAPVVAAATGLRSLFVERELSHSFVKELKTNRNLIELHWVSPAHTALFDLWWIMKKNKTNLATLILESAALDTIALINMDKAMASTKTLKHLEFRSCRVDANGFNGALGQLENNNSVEELVITDSVTPVELDSRFAKGVANGVIVSLEISEVVLTGPSCINLSRLLSSDTCVLRTLNLSFNKMDAKMLNNIFRGMRTNKSVTSLNLYNSLVVDDTTPLVFGSMLKENRTLTHLMIGGHRTLLNVEYTDFLAQLQHSTLTHLDIDNAIMYDQHIAQVANMVRKSPCLVELNMAGSVNSSESAKYLLEAAAASKSLTGLSMADAEIDDEVKDALRGLLVSDTCPLSVLNLENTDLGDATLDHIASAVALNEHLESFVFGVSATEAGVERFMDTIEVENQTLTFLDIANAGQVEGRVLGFYARNARPFFRKRQASASTSSFPLAKSPRSD